MYDIHTHFIPTEVINWLIHNKDGINAKFEQKDPQKAEFLNINQKWAFELKAEFVDSSLYLKEQEDAGVSHSLVSPIPQLFLYDFSKELTSELAAVYNKSLAQWVQANSNRLSALATVPLNDPEQAAIELANAMNLGLKGAIIGPGCSGHMLTDEFFIPFWEEANRLGAIIFIHPLLCEDPRLNRRMMPNLIGVPWETTICATDLLLSGMLDKYPKVKILLAHGGGFLPYQIGRLDKGYDKWKPVSSALQAPPTEYLKRFWYDTVLWNQQSLNYLIELVGEDRVVSGSDYPFDLCAWPPYNHGEKGFQSLMSDK
jgi:predicted TIM-barrel fold metal-dependent hydrolase